MGQHDDLDDLKKRIDAIRKEDIEVLESKEERQIKSEYMGTGLRSGMELIVAIGAGGGIGFALDRYFETMPLFFITLLVLGICTGFYNVYRLTTETDNS